MFSQFGFRSDQKLTDVLRSSRFTLSAEVIPPRNGTEQNQVFGQIQELIGAGAQFLAVTKGAGGSLRGGSLPIAQAIKDRLGVPTIAHFTCRDLTPHEVENQLVDHAYFGIRNILALRGDPPTDQKDWVPKPDSYPFAHQLIAQIRAMNEGRYLARASDRSSAAMKTDFCIGAAVYPEYQPIQEQLQFFRQKVDAGAEFAITQMLFNPDHYERFLELCAKHQISIPILPGTRVLKSKKQALTMATRFGVEVPGWMLERLPEEGLKGAEQLEVSTEIFLELCDRLKRAGAPGIHLFVLSDTQGSCALLTKLLKSLPNTATPSSDSKVMQPSVSP